MLHGLTLRQTIQKKNDEFICGSDNVGRWVYSDV